MYIFYAFFYIKTIYFLYVSETLFEKIYFGLLSFYLLLFPYFSYINRNDNIIIKLNKSMMVLPLFVLLPYKNIQLCNYLFYFMLVLMRVYYKKCPLRILTNSEPKKGSVSFHKKNLIMLGLMYISLAYYFYL